MISFLRYFLLLHYISPLHCTFHETYTFVLLSMIVHSLHDCIVLFLIAQFFSCWHDTFRTSVHDCSDFSSIFQDCNYIFLIMVTSQHAFVSPSAFSRRAVVSYWRKYVHEVLVNRLGGLSLPRKSVVRLTDRPDMTLDVYRGRKTTIQYR